jgi:hypothetical protein
MSDNWIALVPRDPRYVPSVSQATRARDRFLELAPEADEIEIKVSDHIQLFDCWANLERITCPFCGADIPLEWWQERLDDDSDHSADNGFKLLAYSVPCCNARCTLNELIYDWPQGFGRFAINAMNPNIGELQDRYVSEFEELLGTPLLVVYRHI